VRIVPSQLALQKATHSQVRAYAQRMIDEHTRFETQMQAMLQQQVRPAVAEHYQHAIRLRTEVSRMAAGGGSGQH
jgi:predicted outer membrane protein